MAELFQKEVRTINEHILNVFEEGELNPDLTIRKFRIVQTEGQRKVDRDVAHYNLDVIIAVGYRVGFIVRVGSPPSSGNIMNSAEGENNKVCK